MPCSFSGFDMAWAAGVAGATMLPTGVPPLHMMFMLIRRPWVPARSEELVQSIAAATAAASSEATDDELHRLVRDNHRLFGPEQMGELAALIASALDGRPEPERVTALRQRGVKGPLRYVR